MSTGIHSQRNRTGWRGLTARVAKYDDPFVHGGHDPNDSPIPRGPER
jgi:hypothetical protein